MQIIFCFYYKMFLFIFVVLLIIMIFVVSVVGLLIDCERIRLSVRQEALDSIVTSHATGTPYAEAVPRALTGLDYFAAPDPKIAYRFDRNLTINYKPRSEAKIATYTFFSTAPGVEPTVVLVRFPSAEAAVIKPEGAIRINNNDELARTVSELSAQFPVRDTPSNIIVDI
jgi:hypothetical protein